MSSDSKTQDRASLRLSVGPFLTVEPACTAPAGTVSRVARIREPLAEKLDRGRLSTGPGRTGRHA